MTGDPNPLGPNAPVYQQDRPQTVAHDYRALTGTEKHRMMLLNDKGQQFIELCEAFGPSREMSLAKTKIEEAVMWSVRSVIGRPM